MKEVSRVVRIEEFDILIDTCVGESQILLEFGCNADIDEYMRNGRTGANPWERMIGFKNPLMALKSIGTAAIDVAREASEGARVFFDGSNEKRTRIYKKMLEKNGISCEFAKDENGDILLEVMLP